MFIKQRKHQPKYHWLGLIGCVPIERDTAATILWVNRKQFVRTISPFGVKTYLHPTTQITIQINS